MLHKDFVFVKSLKEEFFSQKRIQDTLRVINGNNISAWEPWWQVEFATFLSLHKGGHEWKREHQIEVDRRRDNNKHKLIADFIIRPKNHLKGKYILLELKQNNSVTTCISNMAKDVLKAQKAKATAIDQRSFWSVGVHPTENIENVKRIVDKAAVKYGIEIIDLYSKQITKTKYSFTIF